MGETKRVWGGALGAIDDFNSTSFRRLDSKVVVFFALRGMPMAECRRTNIRMEGACVADVVCGSNMT